MASAIDYNAEYDNSARVENAAELINKYISDAAQFRETTVDRSMLDLSYGPGDRNMVDIFWPDTDAGRDHSCPIVVFIHGGYWQRMDRSSFSHLAIGLNANGIAVAMPSYTLCPDISISGIITEMRRACLVLFQTYKKKLTVIGHSAGGHLAACMMATDWEGIHPQLPSDLVASGMGISGLYDLVPLLQTSVNDAVGMDENEALSASPIRWMPEAVQRFEAWVGAAESSEYHRQSKQLAERWTMLGTPTDYVSVPFANHFTVVDQLTNAESNMVQRIVFLSDNPKSNFSPADVDEKVLTSVLKRFAKEAKKLAKQDETGPSHEPEELDKLEPDDEVKPEPDSEVEPGSEPEPEIAPVLAVGAEAESAVSDDETPSSDDEPPQGIGAEAEAQLSKPAAPEATDVVEDPPLAEGEPEQAASSDETNTTPQKQAK